MDNNEGIVKEVTKEENINKKNGEVGFFGRLIISIADQTIVAFLAFVLFFIVSLILKVIGYKIVVEIGIYFFTYVTSNILYYTITKNSLGRTLGEKIFNVQ